VSEERTAARLADSVAAAAVERGVTIAVAESLTGGMISSALSGADNASEWFRGGVVAYSSEVKFELLGVPPGPVVSEQAAVAMARAVAHLMRADVTVAVTGVGGPGPRDGLPPGTVWFARVTGSTVDAVGEQFEGDDPAEICSATRRRALELLADGLAEIEKVREESARPGRA
jgi:nicotinamide-nucleotide amidase